MRLTKRQDIIVGLLRIHNNVGTSVLVLHTGAPAASVRRNIGSLRNKGFYIESTRLGYTLLDELDAPSAFDTDIDTGDENDHLTRQERLQALADSGTDTWEEYNEIYGDPFDDDDWGDL